jgi:hypothetical protein
VIEPEACAAVGGNYVGTDTACAATTACVVLDAPFIMPTGGGVVLDAVVGDLDGEFGPDVAVLSPGSAHVFLNHGADGAGDWLGMVGQTPVRVAPNPGALTLANVRGDSRPDVVFADPSSAAVWILTNDGAGGLSIGGSVMDHRLDRPARITALDGGFYDDLVVAGADDGWWSLWLHDGPGFTIIDQPALGGRVLVLESGDVDADGLEDVIASIVRPVDPMFADLVGAPELPEISILCGDLGGAFQTPIIHDAGCARPSLTLPDMDGDGRRDIVTIGDDGTVGVMFNDAAAPFEVTSDFPANASPRSLDVGDLSGDGLPDVAVASGDAASASIVTVLPGQVEAPLLGDVIEIDMLAPTRAVFVVDLDGDGRDDLLTASDAGFLVARLGAEPAPPPPPAPDPCPADVNDDGEVDGRDLALVMTAVGTCPPDPATCAADVNGDGVVDEADIEAIAAALGPCAGEPPPPTPPGVQTGPTPK